MDYMHSFWSNINIEIILIRFRISLSLSYNIQTNENYRDLSGIDNPRILAFKLQ